MCDVFTISAQEPKLGGGITTCVKIQAMVEFKSLAGHLADELFKPHLPQRVIVKMK